jgi:hypothetical protein
LFIPGTAVRRAKGAASGPGTLRLFYFSLFRATAPAKVALKAWVRSSYLADIAGHGRKSVVGLGSYEPDGAQNNYKYDRVLGYVLTIVVVPHPVKKLDHVVLLDDSRVSRDEAATAVA